MVSYCRRPGGHCGSSFSSSAAAAAAAEFPEDPPSATATLSSSSLPLSKKEPEKSSVRARMEVMFLKEREMGRERKGWSWGRVRERAEEKVRGVVEAMEGGNWRVGIL